MFEIFLIQDDGTREGIRRSMNECVLGTSGHPQSAERNETMTVPPKEDSMKEHQIIRNTRIKRVELFLDSIRQKRWGRKVLYAPFPIFRSTSLNRALDPRTAGTVLWPIRRP